MGAQALADTAADSRCDSVMAAIVGAAGLPAALAAARSGKRVLLANKEALVAAGSFFMRAIRDNGAELLPIDSEHNAIFQCMPRSGLKGGGAGCARAWRAAPAADRVGRPVPRPRPGRPARRDPGPGLRPSQLEHGPQDFGGFRHHAQQGLEVIEAHWLFAMPADRIEVVVHPQSVVHSMVEYNDGSVLAQLGQPDMRTPIAYGLGFPERLESGVNSLDLTRLGRLDFEKPDLARFPCLALSFAALRAGQGACVALNAANEVAVEAFLSGRLPYTWIPRVIEASLEWQARQASVTLNSLDDVLALDAAARAYAGNLGLA